LKSGLPSVEKGVLQAHDIRSQRIERSLQAHDALFEFVEALSGGIETAMHLAAHRQNVMLAFLADRGDRLLRRRLPRSRILRQFGHGGRDPVDVADQRPVTPDQMGDHLAQLTIGLATRGLGHMFSYSPGRPKGLPKIDLPGRPTRRFKDFRDT